MKYTIFTEYRTLSSFTFRARTPALFVFVVWFIARLGADTPTGTNSPRPSTTADRFELPQPGHLFVFPADHGNHPGFKLEWWYITGHLHNSAGRRFGFQATFFRFAGLPRSRIPNPDSPTFSHSPLYLAHIALLSVDTGKFLHQSRLNRSGWDAGSSGDHLSVWNGNWKLEGRSMPVHADWDSSSQIQMELSGSVGGDGSYHLNLVPLKPLVIFGTNQVSRKGSDVSSASYYLTFPRLRATGTVTWGGERLPVDGEAWMDHEISSSQLSSGQVGWDWACVQLNDGRELMSYRLRREDGSVDPFSTLTWVGRDGRLQCSGANQFSWKPTATWTSTKSGATYPNRVQLEAIDPETGKLAVLQLEPLAMDQEMVDPLGGIAYWEGGCRVRDPEGHEVGKAYLELAGYSGNLARKLK